MSAPHRLCDLERASLSLYSSVSSVKIGLLLYQLFL